MDEILAATFRRAVHDRLDYLDVLATDGDLRSRAALANTEITRLTSAWRSLLRAHQARRARPLSAVLGMAPAPSTPARSGPPPTSTSLPLTVLPRLITAGTRVPPDG